MNSLLIILKAMASGLIVGACALFYTNVYAQCGFDSSSVSEGQCRQRIQEEEQTRRNNSSYYENGNSAPVYVPPKASKYGAVAWNSAIGEFGSSTLQPNKQKAKQEALKNCGGGACEVTTTYSNQCVAVAWGMKTNGSGLLRTTFDLSLDQAKSKTLDACGAEAANCQIYLAECSLP